MIRYTFHPPSSSLTCALATSVEELQWPPFTVIHIAESIGSTPGSGVYLDLSTGTSALQWATNIVWVRPQSWTALLGLKRLHCHTCTWELGQSAWQPPKSKATYESPPQQPLPQRQEGHWSPPPELLLVCYSALESPCIWHRESDFVRSCRTGQTILQHSPAPPLTILVVVCLLIHRFSFLWM